MTKEGRTLPITCKPSSKIGAPTPFGKVRPVLTVVPGAADGRRLVVRNGTHQPREVLTSAGAVEVVVPRVNDRRVDPDTGGTPAVLLGDHAALMPHDTEDHRGVPLL